MYICMFVCLYVVSDAVNCPCNRDHLPDKVLLYYGPYAAAKYLHTYAAAKYLHTAHRKVIPYQEGGRDCMDSQVTCAKHLFYIIRL